VFVFQAFHFATLNEYYTGSLILPPLNGVSDGSIVLIFCCIFTGIVGNNFWVIPIFDAKWM